MRGSHTAREKEHKASKEFVPPRWLVTLVWLIGFFAVWEIIAVIVQASGGSNTVFPHLYDMIYWCFSTQTVVTATQSYSLCGVYIWSYLRDMLGLYLHGDPRRRTHLLSRRTCPAPCHSLEVDRLRCKR